MPLLLLLLSCALGSSGPAPPDTPAARAVAQIGRASAEAEAIAALAARAEALGAELRTGARPREVVRAELDSTLAELEARQAALDAQLDLVRAEMLAPQ